MMLLGRIEKVKGQRWWYATCESVGAHTQGRSRKDALFMLADCIETLADHPGFKVTVSEVSSTNGVVNVLVKANDSNVLIATLLKHQRHVHGLSLTDVTRKLGRQRAKEYARAEQGRTEVSLSRLNAMLGVVAPEMAVVVSPRALKRGA